MTAAPLAAAAAAGHCHRIIMVTRQPGPAHGGPQPGADGTGGPRQVLSRLSNEQVEALVANATLLVVGAPSGGAKLQPPAMAMMAAAMPRLLQVAVVVASQRGGHLAQLALIEAPKRRAKVLYNPQNRRAADRVERGRRDCPGPVTCSCFPLPAVCCRRLS
jgi:hypothetical protein